MSVGAVQDDRLLRAMAEDLKLPLLQIARQAELGSATESRLAGIATTAEMSLRLIDGFLLGLEQRSQTVLNLEPVSVSSIFYDTAQLLERIARQHDCVLEVRLSGRYGPVMANAKNLQVAFTLLGYSLIETSWHETKHHLALGAHRSARGLVAGLFANQPGLTTDMLRRGRALYGSARQALPAIAAGYGGGLFIADSLLKNMAAPLHLARHDNMNGLAATLVTSKQLQLV